MPLTTPSAQVDYTDLADKHERQAEQSCHG